jgi:hypothetical protein
MHKRLTNLRGSVLIRFFTPPAAVVASVLAPLIAVYTAARGEAFKPLPTTGEANVRKAARTDSEILTVIPTGTTDGDGRRLPCWMVRVSGNGHDGYATGRILGSQRRAGRPASPFGPKTLVHRKKAAKAAREHEEHEHEEGGAEHSFIGAAGEWPLNRGRPNFGGTIAAEIAP